ncbi:MAG: tRNA (adenosine(37)-N6)-threonylcarbamoyltransferase complex ATPase subunit type 1 TsaE [Anaerolineae bacterium]
MPILSPDAIEFISRSPEQTRRVGARLGMLLSGGAVVALEGNLGTGKTVLAQGIGIGWGATTSLISPTFIIIRRHTRNQDDEHFYHIDLYRIAGSTEAEALGLTELLGDPGTVCVVEWAERAADLFPEERLWVTLRALDEQRRSLTFRATGDRHRAIQEKLRKELAGY